MLYIMVIIIKKKTKNLEKSRRYLLKIVQKKNVLKYLSSIIVLI